MPEVHRVTGPVPFAQAVDVEVSRGKQEEGGQGISRVPGQPQVVAGVYASVGMGNRGSNQQLPRSDSAHPDQHPTFEANRPGSPVFFPGTSSPIDVFFPGNQGL